MKRLFLSAAALILAPLTAFAISINDLTNNPDQYKKILEEANNIVYLDVYSVESLRYSPPYYTMRGHFYSASYSRNSIEDFIVTADFDYNRSMKAIVNRDVKEGRKFGHEKTFDEVFANYKRQVAIDSGISANLTNIKVWDLDGNFVKNEPPLSGRKADFGTYRYYLASSLFKQYYNENF